MVKGISRQVILVPGPGEELFDQAIFILKDNAVSEGISDDALLREARQVMRGGGHRKRNSFLYGIFWSLCGSLLTGAVWALSVILAR